MEISVSAGRKEKGDAFVTASNNGNGKTIVSITSPVRALFSEAQDAAVSRALDELDAGDLVLTVEDCQALDFVITARVKAAVLRLRRKENI